MKNALLALIAIGAGALASDWSASLPVVHEVAGQIFQRGKLIAVVGQRESSRRILEHVSERNNFAQEEKIPMKLRESRSARS